MTLLSVAVAALFVASGWWSLQARVVYDGNGLIIGAEAGRLGFIAGRTSTWKTLKFPGININRRHEGWPDLNFGRSFDLAYRADPVIVRPGFIRTLDMPLQLILLAVVGPTALLWWLDRRKHPPGHCPHCGYDLTGNESGVCPECGRAVESSRAGEGTRRASSAAK